MRIIPSTIKSKLLKLITLESTKYLLDIAMG